MNRRALNNAIAGRLSAVTNAVGYYGQIGRPLPGLELTTPKDPPVKADGTGRVAPYFIYYPGMGGSHPDAAVCRTGTPLQGTHAITAAAGDVEDLGALVDRLDALLHEWHPDMGTKVERREGYEPPQLTDTSHTPNRLYTPLQYLATTA